MHVGSAVLKPAVDTCLVDARVGHVGSAEEHDEGLAWMCLRRVCLVDRCWVLGEERRKKEAASLPFEPLAVAWSLLSERSVRQARQLADRGRPDDTSPRRTLYRSPACQMKVGRSRSAAQSQIRRKQRDGSSPLDCIPPSLVSIAVLRRAAISLSELESMREERAVGRMGRAIDSRDAR
jgi:hypothetical protein